MNQKQEFKFRIGYHYFHPDKTINFQINRLYSIGWGKFEEWRLAALKIKNFSDWKTIMTELAERAEAEQRLKDAIIYYRAAEFFTFPSDPDKDHFYDKFTTLFDQVFEKDGFKRYEIPYESGKLPVLHMKPKNKTKDIIVIHGGFDSFIEEFYPLVYYVVNKGYEVILFEGPGQGRTLHKYHLPMIYNWEKPTKKILDYFNLSNVTLIGVSLGGYLAPRAAAFDKRIARVVSFNTLFNGFDLWLTGMNRTVRLFFKLSFKLRASFIINGILQRARKKDMFLDWGLSHGNYVTGTKTPYEFFKSNQNYSLAKISERITQDYLILAAVDEFNGKAPEFLEKQVRVAKNAKSITSHIFTREELQCYQAEHCQVGNLKLTLDFILDWIERHLDKENK